MAVVNGTSGDDTLNSTGDPNGDVFTGGQGNDTINGGGGNDTVNQNVLTDGADTVNLGGGSDLVNVSSTDQRNVRLIFTSAEVGNGSSFDSGTQANQDGGLAVRMQREALNGAATGPVSRYDDEGITFDGGANVTFDVRDLVSGAQRGQQFNVVTLGTQAGETINAGTPSIDNRNYYVNGGQGNDTITSQNGNDFLVGGAGADELRGGGGSDSYIGGGGNDTIIDQGVGDVDRVIMNVTSDGADYVVLGDGLDNVTVNAASTTNVRVTFISANVGNGDSSLSGSTELAVRLQAEDGSDVLTGPVSQFDDEGITFTGGPGVSFDVRDLVSGAERGEFFKTVTLGTAGNDSNFSFSGSSPFAGTSGNDYINGGGGADTMSAGEGQDFLVGGAGDDNLTGGAGRDQFLGGGGNDTIDSVDRPSNVFAGAIAPERDVVDAGAGNDTVTGGRLDRLIGGDGFDTLLLNFDFNGPFTSNPPEARPAVNLRLNSLGNGTANDGTVVIGFENVIFNLTDNADTVNTGNVRASLTGNGGDDVLTTGSGTIAGFSFGGESPLIGDELFGGAGNDILRSGGGNDMLSGGTGDDQLFGEDGDDSVTVDMGSDGADQVDLGQGADTVTFGGFSTGQIRITLTNAEVGDGSANQSGGVAGQDGGLSVSVQMEDSSGALTGPLSRYDDEGIQFIAGTQGVTFDVRDVAFGSDRGTVFEGVVLGSASADDLTFFPPFRAGQAFFYNAGRGNDLITAGDAGDYLIGGDGDDTLNGGGGDNRFVGGAGNDTIVGGSGGDRIATFNVSQDGADTVNLGQGNDFVSVTASAATNVRLTFTSAEVGNGSANDRGGLTNQDGGLAVRLQAETGGTPAGALSRFDDEGITFVGGDGVTFDVRDLVSGAARGEAFEVVRLGSNRRDAFSALDDSRSTYFNGGGGNDALTGGSANDFLVGGAGDDTLSGGGGVDTFIGGGGADRLVGGAGGDRFIFTSTFESTGAALDTIVGFSAGDGDLVNLSAIDADFNTSGDQAFTFVNAFSGQAGEAVLTSMSGRSTLSVDVSGDGVADMTLLFDTVVDQSGFIL